MRKTFLKLKKLGYISIEIVIIAAIMLVSGFTAVGSFVEDGQKATNDAASKIDETLNLAGGGEGAGPGGSGGGSLPEIPEEEVESGDAYALILDNGGNPDDSMPMIFVRSETPIAAGDVYDSETYGSLNVVTSYSGIEERDISNATANAPWNALYRDTITSVIAEDRIAPVNLYYWFNLQNADYFDLTKVDTSNVHNMSYAFQNAGYYSNSFIIIGLDSWDTSKTEKMDHMFYRAGYSATESWDIGDLSSWDVSNLTKFYSMFQEAAYMFPGELTLTLANWEPGLATDTTLSAESLFKSFGRKASSFSLNGLNTWNTSKINKMNEMFYGAGDAATTTYSIGNNNLSGWNTDNVTGMSQMFASSAVSYTGDLRFDFTGWKISGSALAMFESFGYKANSVTFVGLETWDTSGMTDMRSMFRQSGRYATNGWTIGSLSGWDVSNVVYMNEAFDNVASENFKGNFYLDVTGWRIGTNTSGASIDEIFNYTAGKASNFTINGLSTWDTSNVVSANAALTSAGYSATNFTTLDLSGWDLSKCVKGYYILDLTTAKYSPKLTVIKTPKNLPSNAIIRTRETWYNVETGEAYEAQTFPYDNAESLTLSTSL